MYAIISGGTTDDRRFCNMNEVHIVLFHLNDSLFGVNAEEVEEIIEYSIQSRDEEHPFIEGYTTVRGVEIPVVNLAGYLGLDESTGTKHSKLILTKIDGSLVGFSVSSVQTIKTLNKEAVQDAPPILTTAKNECIKKFAIDGENIVPVINLQSIKLGN